MIVSSQIQYPPFIQIRNGKLVVVDPNGLNSINNQMENIAQQLEEIELEVVTAQEEDRREYINQLKIIKASIQNLEHSYNQLLYTTIVIGVVLTALLIWIGLARQPSCNNNQAQLTTTLTALGGYDTLNY